MTDIPEFDLDLEFLPEGYLAEVFAFADRRGIRDDLVGMLNYLAQRRPGDRRTRLGKDFAPWSFTFQHFRGDEPWINGGLIYYGPGDQGFGAPQFSVRMPNETKEGWSSHT